MGMIINPYRFQPVGSALPPGALAYWKFENNLDDEGGLYNLINPSGVSYPAGVSGQGMSGIAQIPAINIGTSFSLQLVAKLTATVGPSGSAIVGDRWNVSGVFGVLTPVNFAASPHQNMRYVQNGSTRITSPNVFSLNTWARHTFIMDGASGTFRWYANNALMGSYSTSIDWQSAVRIGRDIGNAYSAAACVIDEMALYPDTSAPIPTPVGNLYASYDCSNNEESEFGWNALSTGSESYATGSDGSSNGAWDHNAVTSDIRRLPTLILGNTWTWEFDVYPYSTSGNDGALFMSGSSSNIIGWSATNKRLIFRENSGNHIIAPNNSLLPDMWTHIKFTYDGSKVRLYTNGVLTSTESGTHSSTFQDRWPSMSTGTNPFGTGYFRGRLDNIRFYNAVV